MLDTAISARTDIKDKRLLRGFAYVNGKWTSGETGGSFAVTDPATGAHLGDVAALSPKQATEAVDSAHAAFSVWAHLLPQERAAVLEDAQGPELSPDTLDEALGRHYDRQRVLFYSAESLRNSARDRTPPETFASLQDDIFHGVIDICDEDHPSSLACLKAAVVAAGQVSAGGNALYAVSAVADRQGICHQLANDDRLTWVKKP